MGWTFKTYVSKTGREDVHIELNKLDGVVKESFRTRLKYLLNTPKLDWSAPSAKKLKGNKDDVYEIRFKENGIQYRPLGFFGPGNTTFTILIWSFKKQDIYTPSDAINSASKRKRQVDSGEATCTNLKIDGEDFPEIE